VTAPFADWCPAPLRNPRIPPLRCQAGQSELAEGVRTYRPADFRRLQVRPGMTGWAVVHGRNEVSVSTRRELDAWYADHLSFLLDLKILIRTIAMVVAGKGIDRTREQPSPHASSASGAEPQ